ncbi:MAG: hypothetical protein M3Q71_09125 [Chloroflexota bacterium]|nr:hypothetical protein [Chloroflexota bacterium]
MVAVVADHGLALAVDRGLVLDEEVDDGTGLGSESNPEDIPLPVEVDVVDRLGQGPPCRSVLR